MLLVLRRSPEQEAALQTVLEQQQNKASPNYHEWLTPEQFAQKFGPAESDIQTITGWLMSKGFTIGRTARGRGVIEFSGTASQVKQAFRTEVHKYLVNGNEHWANSSDPTIPDAFAPVVAGISSLHNFARKPMHRLVPGVESVPRSPLVRDSTNQNSLWTTGSACGLAAGPCHVVTPYDFATIYNVLPLWNAQPPIDGAGQTIAIVGQTDIYPQDFSTFRQTFGLPPGTLNIVYDGVSPGKLASQGDELEADLDVQISGAVAKGATIDLVVSATTNTTAGVDLSALYIVDNNLAPILSDSYGACELEMGTTANQFYNQLWQQAAAEGISVFVATGDSGSTVCDQNLGIATNGLAVSGLSSTPYNTAVGGTDFADFSNASLYWSSSNDPTTLASAKSYVPESTWNDTCTNEEFFVLTGDTTAEGQCNDSSSRFWPNYLSPVGGSGGKSNCTTPTGSSSASCAGGYSKPSWQTGPGVPNDGKRDVPDVSLFAADGLNSSFYVACETDIYAGCVALGGTSASAPAFAGIMALVNQKTQSRQGNANYRLYPLASQRGASCDSAGSPGASCLFHDVTTGTIAMPCLSGAKDCITGQSVDIIGVLSGFTTNAGYDPAVGLGSVNVANLVNSWNSVSFTPTVATLSLSSTSFVHGTPVDVIISVAPQSGAGSPSGLASLITSNGTPAGTFSLSGGSVSSTTRTLPGGNYTLSAHYSGDGIYAASNSSPGIAVNVTPELSTLTMRALTFDQSGNAIPYSTGPYGAAEIFIRASVAGQSAQGIPTGTINLTETVNGVTTNYPQNPYRINIQGFTIAEPPNPPSVAYAPGTYTVNGTYGGDSGLKSSKTSTTFTVNKAPADAVISQVLPCLQPQPCSLQAGSKATIFANVNGPNSPIGDSPSGTVTFYANGTPLGPPVTLDKGIAPPIAAIDTTLPPGLDNLTVQYSGDSNYVNSTSPQVPVGVGQTFTTAANPASIEIASPGQSGSTMLIFTAQNGFTATANLSSATCSTLPPESACNFDPATVTLTPSTPSGAATLTINTSAPHVRSAPAHRAAAHGKFGYWSLAGALMAVVVLVSARSGQRRSVLAVFTVLLIAGAIGCGGAGTGGTGAIGGGGGAGSGGGSTGDPGTSRGSYSVTVTVALNGITQSISVGVVVH